MTPSSPTPGDAPVATTTASLESTAEAGIKNLRDRIASKVAQLRKRDGAGGIRPDHLND